MGTNYITECVNPSYQSDELVTVNKNIEQVINYVETANDYQNVDTKSEQNQKLITSHALLENLDLDEFWKKHAIIRVPADGHCLIHSVVAAAASHSKLSKQITYDSLLAQIEVEVLSKLDEYSAYRINRRGKINPARGKSHDSELILLNEMYDYIFGKHWNTSFGDMVPLLAANCLGINIGIIKKTLEQYEYTPVFSERQTDDFVFIHLQCSHYNAIYCSDPTATYHVDF